MGLLIDLRGRSQGHRFWKRKLDVASKVTDPLSLAAWPPSPSLPSPRANVDKRFQRAAMEHREPHLFGASASTEPPADNARPTALQPSNDQDKERIRERQRRYKQQLDEQVRAVLNQRHQEKKVEGNGYDGGIFRRLGEHVVHDGSQSAFDHHRKMLDDLDEQIRLKEARLIAEYEAGQKKDAKTESESFLVPEHDRDAEWDSLSPRRFYHRSLLASPNRRIPIDVKHPPWAIDAAVNPRPGDDSRNVGIFPSAAGRPYRNRSRPLFSESSERLDKILMDFLDEPIQL